MASSPQFQSKILRRKTTPDEYRTYRAALEWDLTDPIIIESRDDLKSEYRWRDRMEPFHHQVTNLMTFCRRLPVTLLADDVGLGKTISAGLIISELISRSRISKFLVVCPKLLGPQWQEELLSKFDISSEIAVGRKLIKADPDEVGAVITTYNSARLHLDSIPQDRFQMLILDEAHKLRNLYGVENPPQVAIRFRKALQERRFRYVLMLTATPIQNRLWDLYSLVDLLTVARGHENPLGSEGMFARKFIADSRDQARQLKPQSCDEFRSIVYGYMSRVRRGDAKLYFPDRVIYLRRVDPSKHELELIRALSKPLQLLNRLAQISILQALTSSPEALMAQLNNMARNRTVSQELALAVSAIVTKMDTSAKLQGLGTLADELRQKNPEKWRMVVFTGRRETQTTIQSFLEQRGLRVGIINGDTGPRNRDTLSRFRQMPPHYHVIVSTEAGSEGINLQVANVLVNYDLPWNPMIVEQRIGRVQRLASEHASVGVFNIILRGTFEEYIVGRLMEKLQMASHAIGDIEALLSGSGLGDDGENGTTKFEERIRQLVMAALAGKDIETATKQAERSIQNAKATLEKEEENINAMLGGMNGIEYVGPRAPKLPSVERSIDIRTFTLSALATLGARVTRHSENVYHSYEDGRREYIRFDESTDGETKATLYASGTPAFSRLVSRVVATGIHNIDDVDQDLRKKIEVLAHQWVRGFDGSFEKLDTVDVQRCFAGKSIVRVRATVAHDSYERLVEVPCVPEDHHTSLGRAGLDPLPSVVNKPPSIGINTQLVADAAPLDDAIMEFSRFYLERRDEEILAAGADLRKRKKLEDDFTPRLAMTLVGLEGTVHRQLHVQVHYSLESSSKYSSALTMAPHSGKLDGPRLAVCARSGRTVPIDCLGLCQVSGVEVLQHLLVKSDVTSRFALPEFTVICGLSAKRLLRDEAEVSAVSGQMVAKSYLKTSAISGKRAEPSYFDRCEYTGTDCLQSELAVSDISGKRYRLDERVVSAISGKAGHKSEFIVCYETKQPLVASEAEQCETTSKWVRPGVLEQCAITHKRVLPTELERCSATGQKALKKLMVASSVSDVRFLEHEAIRSAAGKFCAPIEAKDCFWSSRKCHPIDIRVCELVGLPMHFEFSTSDTGPRLRPLIELLNGIKRTADESGIWPTIATQISSALGGKRSRIESAQYSPDRKHLAVCTEVRSLLGLRVHCVGAVYSINDRSIIGHVVLGKRGQYGWVRTTS